MGNNIINTVHIFNDLPVFNMKRIDHEREMKKHEVRYKMLLALKILLALSIFATMILLFAFFFDFEKKRETEPEYRSIRNLSVINYDDLNESEIEIVNSWIYELKTEYYNLGKSITFTKNQSVVMKHYNGDSTSLCGLNLDNGEKIYVYYNCVNPKKTLCHELLHSIFGTELLEKETEQRFVYDLANYYVCYKSNNLNK